MTWDSEVRGLHIVTRKDGVASYYLYYRTKSHVQRRGKIGDTSLLTLAEARKEARRMLAEVTLGGDPLLEVRTARQGQTVGTVFEELMKEHYGKERFQSSGYDVQARMHYRNHLERRFGGKKLFDVTPPIIRSWHLDYEEWPSTGNRAKAVLSKIFSFAEMKGYAPPGSNPCKSVPNFTEKKRTRFASEEEIRRVGEVLVSREGRFPRESAFIYALILSGSRPSALARVERKHVHPLPDGSSLIQVRGKTGMDTIIMPKFVMDRVIGCEPVFGVFPRRYWDDVRKEAGCPDLWARDWRRTFGVIALSGGMTLGAIGQLLNHKCTQTTVRYTALVPDAQMKNSQQVASHLQQWVARGV